MTRPFEYRMPSGAEIIRVERDIVTMQISMPADDAGHIGRQCPACSRLFRMHVEDYRALPDDQRLTCPYCCAEDDHREFVTAQQRDRAMGGAAAFAEQFAAEHLRSALEGMVRSVNSRGGMVRMSLSRPRGSSLPNALPAITEEAPIRERACERCTNRYAVFGEHVACPVCGRLPNRVVALDALDAQEALLGVFDQLPADVLRQLREGGALERSASGALGSMVSIVETFLKETFLERVTGAATLITGRGNVFQRLDDAAELYRAHLGVDLPGSVGLAGWDRLRVLYGVRHLLTHNNGVVDAKHLARFPARGFVMGQRVSASMADAHDAVGLARSLIGAIP